MSTPVSGPEPRSGAWQSDRYPGAALAAALALTVAGLAYLRNTDPRGAGRRLPRCPFNWATGLLCPACGGTRMTYDLMHGDVRAAFRDNSFLFLASPYALALAAHRACAAARGRPNDHVPRGRGPLLVLGTAVAWTIMRNTSARGRGRAR